MGAGSGLQSGSAGSDSNTELDPLYTKVVSVVLAECCHHQGSLCLNRVGLSNVGDAPVLNIAVIIM